MLTRNELTQWTTFLRANPEKQTSHVLKNEKGEMCCLGALAECMGVKANWDFKFLAFYFDFDGVKDSAYLAGNLLKKFGSRYGRFKELRMPNIRHEGALYCDAADANDAGVPWAVIADHFDKHYPCADEPPKDWPKEGEETAI